MLHYVSSLLCFFLSLSSSLFFFFLLINPPQIQDSGGTCFQHLRTASGLQKNQVTFVNIINFSYSRIMFSYNGQNLRKNSHLHEIELNCGVNEIWRSVAYGFMVSPSLSQICALSLSPWLLQVLYHHAHLPVRKKKDQIKKNVFST